MKKIIVITVILALVVCGMILVFRTPRRLSRLHVHLTATEGRSAQRVRAIQGGTNWNWRGGGYSSDSLHPLQIHDFTTATLYLNSADGEIVLRFSGRSSPTTVYAMRWRAEYATIRPISDVSGRWESVEVDGRTIRISNDGDDYIYQVAAHWSGTDSFASYTFRVMSGGE